MAILVVEEAVLSTSILLADCQSTELFQIVRDLLLVDSLSLTDDRSATHCNQFAIHFAIMSLKFILGWTLECWIRSG